MVHFGRPILLRSLFATHSLFTVRLRSLFAVLLLLVLALVLEGCGGTTPGGPTDGDLPAPAESTPVPSAETGGTGDGAVVAATGSAEPERTPRPTATPAFRVAFMHWGEGETSSPSVEWAVTGGAAVIENERFCLSPSGADTALALVPAMALADTGDTLYGILSAQVLASPPNVEGTVVGLAACGALLQINDQQQWRQTPLGADGTPGQPGEWLTNAGIRLGGQHELGILCETGTTTLVGDGTILIQQSYTSDAPPHVGLGAMIPSGAGEQVCFDDLRVQVWPDAPDAGDDRAVFLYDLGTPDAFAIAFEQTPEGGLYRVETWSYVEVGMTLTFADGVLIQTGSIDVSEDDISAWPVDYDLLSFEAGMTLDAVQGLLAGQELVSLEVPEEFGADTVLYAGDQIVLGFTEGELEFVETLAITVDTLGGEP